MLPDKFTRTQRLFVSKQLAFIASRPLPLTHVTFGKKILWATRTSRLHFNVIASGRQVCPGDRHFGPPIFYGETVIVFFFCFWYHRNSVNAYFNFKRIPFSITDVVATHKSCVVLRRRKLCLPETIFLSFFASRTTN